MKTTQTRGRSSMEGEVCAGSSSMCRDKQEKKCKKVHAGPSPAKFLPNTAASVWGLSRSDITVCKQNLGTVRNRVFILASRQPCSRTDLNPDHMLSGVSPWIGSRGCSPSYSCSGPPSTPLPSHRTGRSRSRLVRASLRSETLLSSGAFTALFSSSYFRQTRFR